MFKQYLIAHPVAAMSAVAFLTLAARCSKSADQNSASVASAATTQTATPMRGKAASKLGNLSAFHSIATDVAIIVDKGDLPSAKAHIKDLEIAWDSAEAGLKPRAADDWHVLDKAIDKSLSTLRADTASQVDCKAAMAALLKTFDTLEGK